MCVPAPQHTSCSRRRTLRSTRRRNITYSLCFQRMLLVSYIVSFFLRHNTFFIVTASLLHRILFLAAPHHASHLVSCILFISTFPYLSSSVFLLLIVTYFAFAVSSSLIVCIEIFFFLTKFNCAAQVGKPRIDIGRYRVDAYKFS
ncbi:hypothetical protein C8R43DRAFT_1043063 [Mycena crocata]|nr:hypothetical protein C8R43DRAFT_1043063 [Mycena crocata]